MHRMVDPSEPVVKMIAHIDETQYAEMWVLCDTDGRPMGGRAHRDDGPAIIIYENDIIIYTQFWLHSTFYPDFKKWLTKSSADDVIKAELALVYG